MAEVRARASAGAGAARALSSATLAFGSTALAIAALLVILRNVNSPAHNAWPAMIFLLPVALLMVLVHRHPSRTAMISYLVVGSAAIGCYAAVILANAPDALVESPFILALPQIAFIFTVSPTLLGKRTIVFGALAYLLGLTSVCLAAWHSERYPAFDVLSLAGVVFVVTVGVTSLFLRRSARDKLVVARAMRDADEIAYQQELETQVVALFHDTVLSELTVLSHHAPGPLGPAERAAIARDLALIDEGAWWPDTSATGSGADGTGADASSGTRGGSSGATNSDPPLPRAVCATLSEARDEGLTIDVVGDAASLQRLESSVLDALALALRQAFVNVRQHSGVERVEVVLDGAPDAVVVMIADAGSGFDQTAIPTDRLGVSRSILGRIAGTGGSAQLFTSPGSGTAYLFTLPVAAEHTWPAPEAAS